MPTELTPAQVAALYIARQDHGCDEVVIEQDEPEFSSGNEGVFVKAWVFVDNAAIQEHLAEKETN